MISQHARRRPVTKSREACAGNLARLPGGIAGQTAAASDLSTNCGKGELSLVASDFGIDLKPKPDSGFHSETDQPLPKPYSLRPEVRKALEGILRQQALFQTDRSELSLVTCRKGPGDDMLCIANDSWRELPLKIVSRCGDIESIHELPLDTSENGVVG